ALRRSRRASPPPIACPSAAFGLPSAVCYSSPPCCSRCTVDRRRSAAQHQKLFDFGDRFGRVEIFWAALGAVQDRVAAVEAERVFQRVEPLAGLLVAAVGDPAVSLQ